MKHINKTLAILIAALTLGFTVSAQEADSAKCETTIEIGVDLMSSYVWRGSAFGTGPAIQPTIELASGNFTLGVWNNINSGSDQAFEVDPYMSYSFPFGVTLGLTDYYFGGNFLGTNFDDFKATHSLEPSFAYEYGDLTFFAALMFVGDEQDFYGEVSYAFDRVDFAVGAGDGQYVTSPEWGTVGEFSICNISLSTEKEIKITDSFKLPMTAAVVLNPYNERLFAYVGISL